MHTESACCAGYLEQLYPTFWEAIAVDHCGNRRQTITTGVVQKRNEQWEEKKSAEERGQRQRRHQVSSLVLDGLPFERVVILGDC